MYIEDVKFTYLDITTPWHSIVGLIGFEVIYVSHSDFEVLNFIRACDTDMYFTSLEQNRPLLF
jgi:hypothetical protein